VATWATGFVGVGLLVAALRNTSPLEQLRAALTGTTATASPLSRAASSIYAAASGSPVSSTPGSIGTVPALVAIAGHGTHRLAPEAAAGFAKWEAAYGQSIPITDSYRSYAQQAAAYASDPVRFAPPDKSWHPKGKAVDVNLPALNIRTGTEASYQRLVSTAQATGWCKSNPREAWHFSFGGCG
jgi:hypothetical protein